jgi:hypothetical protein
MDTGDTTTARLKLYAEILSLIEERRQVTGAPMLGAAIEKFIVDAQFAELETDILEDPGAFERWLIRPRRPL